MPTRSAYAPGTFCWADLSNDLGREQARVGELGGRRLDEPRPAGPGRFVVATDPAGATFGLHAGEMED